MRRHEYKCRFRKPQQRRSDMPETDRFLRMRSVLERVGFSRSTLYRKMQEGTFPRQVQISDYCRGWRESLPEHFRTCLCYGPRSMS